MKAKTIWEQEKLTHCKTASDVDAEIVRVQSRRDPTGKIKPARLSFLNKLRDELARKHGSSI